MSFLTEVYIVVYLNLIGQVAFKVVILVLRLLFEIADMFVQITVSDLC